ncbi:MAG: cephalosporin hydroxylase family protein [Actinomycetota bacterium]|nr:cephalosporin hydroxylase family protein [Actinomycetota bacterium]MEE2958174.1 cephalosporin hydroxylase family protein [Actinomycetota bacterium]
MSQYARFRAECAAEVEAQGSDEDFEAVTREWFDRSIHSRYSYHFEWLGRPVIQYPQDVVAMQEILFEVKPDLVIETGIAHGGSLVLYSSLLELNALHGGPVDARVLGIDIDIRSHNRAAIEAHPMAARIDMIEGSSTDPEVVKQVHRAAEGRETVLVCLDSLHSHDHVLAELDAYAHLTSVGSYCVVFDTVAEMLPQSYFEAADRRCGPGDSPMTALDAFLVDHPEFEVASEVSDRLLITVAPGGYLRRIA